MPLLHRQVKKQYKGSHGARNYSWKLCASKKLCFNERNCKSGRHDRTRRKVLNLRPTSVHCKAHKIRLRKRSKDLLECVLQIKTRSAGKYKVSPPRRLYQIIRAFICRNNIERHKLSGANHSVLPPEEPNLCDNFISKKPGYFDCFCNNFPRHFVFGLVQEKIRSAFSDVTQTNTVWEEIQDSIMQDW